MSLSIKEIIDSFKGIAGTGDLIGRVNEIGKQVDRILTMEPGDWTASSRKNPIAMAAPIAYDLWYLHSHVNFITFVRASGVDVKGVNVEEFVEDRLDFFASKLGRIKPMLGMEVVKVKDTVKSFTAWKSEAKYFIQLMAFEIRNKKDRFLWDSGAKKTVKMVRVDTSVEPHKVIETDEPGAASLPNLVKDDCVGYLTFPIGQLGVIEQIAFFQQSMTEVKDFKLTDVQLPFEVKDKVLFPPKEGFKKESFGTRLITKGYILPVAPKDKAPDVSLVYKDQIDCFAEPIPESAYTKDVKPKGWLRLWIKREDTFPIPGEFIGFACKPVVAPPHCWWFQETIPFVYAGNWVDTRNLTSGVITEVTEDVEHPNGTTCTKYKIKIHGIELTVFSSDFVVYEVGKRVAVLKLQSIEDSSEKAFTFVDQKTFGDPVKDKEEVNYVVIPMTFFVKET